METAVKGKELKVERAIKDIKRAIEKLFGVAGLIDLQETTDDLILDAGTRPGVAAIIRDRGYEIDKAMEVITKEEEVTS